MRTIAEPAYRKPGLHGLLHQVLLRARADDQQLHAGGPIWMTQRVQHQIDAVPARQAAEKRNKWIAGPVDRPEQVGVGAVRNHGDAIVRELAGEPLRKLLGDWKQLIRHPVLRAIKPAHEASHRRQPRMTDDDVELDPVDLLCDHASKETRPSGHWPRQRMCADVKHIVAVKLQDRPRNDRRIDNDPLDRPTGTALTCRLGRKQVDAPTEPAQIVDDFVDVDMARLPLVRDIKREIGEPELRRLRH